MNCADCHVDTEAIHEYYMVTEEVWRQASKDSIERDHRVLCIGCLEARIGRELTAADFTNAPVNTSTKETRSPRLEERLRRTTR